MDGLEEVRAAVAGICKEVSELEIEEIYSELVDPDTPPELVEPKSPPRRAGSASRGASGRCGYDSRKRGDGRLFPPKAKSIACLLSKYAVP